MFYHQASEFFQVEDFQIKTHVDRIDPHPMGERGLFGESPIPVPFGCAWT